MHDSHNNEDEYYDDDVPLVFTGPIVDDPCREIFDKIDSKKGKYISKPIHDPIFPLPAGFSVEDLVDWNEKLGYGIHPRDVFNRIYNENKKDGPYPVDLIFQIEKISNAKDRIPKSFVNTYAEWFNVNFHIIKKEKLCVESNSEPRSMGVKEPEYNGNGKSCLIPLLLIISIFFAMGAVIARTLPF